MELVQLERLNAATRWKFQRDGWHGANALEGSSNLEWLKEFADWELKIRMKNAEPTYIVQGRRLGERFNSARWQWADFRDGRLIWAQDGKIFAAPIWEGGSGPALQLADFNSWTFEPIAAPY